MAGWVPSAVTANAAGRAAAAARAAAETMATRRRTGAPLGDGHRQRSPGRGLLLLRPRRLRARSPIPGGQVVTVTAGARSATANSSEPSDSSCQECPMKRALVHLLPGAVIAAGSAYALADDPGAGSGPQWTGLRAGVGAADATWHLGAGAGQYAAVNNPSDLSSEWDPNVQHVKQSSSYGVASRLTMRAIVLQDGQGHAPVALLKVDNYLAQDYLTRRIAAILAADGSKVTYDHIVMSATHNHNSPYYSTPSWGVWAFQDAMDLRMFEYSARQGAAAIEQAEASMAPARVGATTVQFPDFQGNIAGQDLDNDGAPAGYPMGVNDHGLTVLRFDQKTDSGWKPLAAYVNYAEHGESLDHTDLISEDWWAPFERFVTQLTSVPVVTSQGSVGSAEGPYDFRYPEGQTPTTTDAGDTVYKIWSHENFAQVERGTHLLAEKVTAAWNAIGSGDASVQAP